MLFVKILDNQLSTLLQNAAAMFGIELHTVFELVSNGIGKVGFRKRNNRNKHVLEFKIAVIALDCLVEQRPNLKAMLLGKLAVFAKKAKSSKTERAGIFIKQSTLRARESLVAGIGVKGEEMNQHLERFPSRLRLRTIESIDECIDARKNRLGVEGCDGRKSSCCILPFTTRRALQSSKKFIKQVGIIQRNTSKLLTLSFNHVGHGNHVSI